MDNVISSAITVIGMLFTSYIGYRTSKEAYKTELARIKLEYKNNEFLSDKNFMITTFSNFLGDSSKSYYMKSEENYIQYLNSYRKFMLVCPYNLQDKANFIHSLIVNAPTEYIPYNDEFETSLNKLSLELNKIINDKKNKI